MPKVRVHAPPKRKRQRRIRASPVAHRRVRQPRQQLVDPPHALRRAERVARAEAEPLAEGLEVVVALPFGVGKYRAESGEGGGGGVRGDDVVRAEVHEEGDFGFRDIRPREGGVEARGDGGREGGEELGLGGGADGGCRAGEEGRAEFDAEGVVDAGALGDGEHGVGQGRGRVGGRGGQAGVEAGGPVLGRVDDAGLARGADEGEGGGGVVEQGPVALVEVQAGAEHVGLAKGGELVGAEGVAVGAEEGVVGGVRGGVGLDAGDEGAVDEGFEGRGVAGAVAGEELGKGELAGGGYGWVDLGGDREEGRVLAPEVGCVGVTLEAVFRGIATCGGVLDDVSVGG